MLIQPLILRHGRLGPRHVFQDARVDLPADQQHTGRPSAELHQRPHPLTIRTAEHSHFAAARHLRCLERRDFYVAAGHRAKPGLEYAREAVEHDGFCQAAKQGLRLQLLAEPEPVEQPVGLTEAERHRQRIGTDGVSMLFQIAARRLEPFVQRRADAVVKPALDAEIEERGRKDGNNDRGRDGHNAE